MNDYLDVTELSGDDVRASKRLYAPSSRLRGFESGKVGPTDGTDHVGGNYVVTLNTSSTIPYVLQTQENMDLKVFFDAGNLSIELSKTHEVLVLADQHNKSRDVLYDVNHKKNL